RAARQRERASAEFWRSPRGRALAALAEDGPTRSLTGTVLGPDGQPVAGATVVVSRHVRGDIMRHLMDADHSQAPAAVGAQASDGAVDPSAYRATRTDATGGFALVDIDAGALYAIAAAPGRGRSIPLIIAPSGDRRDLIIQLRAVADE
ncbi:MAG: hypothetical protein AAGC55_07815, partial [Myxococcota bacterium]